ncbi:hypothetical protein FOXYSP1_17173 [Fusarium oxysporum f. sp. phaseoli]
MDTARQQRGNGNACSSKRTQESTQSTRDDMVIARQLPSPRGKSRLHLTSATNPDKESRRINPDKDSRRINPDKESRRTNPDKDSRRINPNKDSRRTNLHTISISNFHPLATTQPYNRLGRRLLTPPGRRTKKKCDEQQLGLWALHAPRPVRVRLATTRIVVLRRGNPETYILPIAETGSLPSFSHICTRGWHWVATVPSDCPAGIYDEHSMARHGNAIPPP